MLHSSFCCAPESADFVENRFLLPVHGFPVPSISVHFPIDSLVARFLTVHPYGPFCT